MEKKNSMTWEGVGLVYGGGGRIGMVCEKKLLLTGSSQQGKLEGR